MERTATDTIKETPSLIAHYRPLRLKAVVAATSVKGRVPKDKQPAEGRNFDGSPYGYLDIPFYD